MTTTGILYAILAASIFANIMIIVAAFIMRRHDREVLGLLVGQHEVFSQIAVNLEAKLNTIRTELTGLFDIHIVTSDVILEIKRSLSKYISEDHPAEAHIEGKTTGHAEEAFSNVFAAQANQKAAEQLVAAQTDPAVDPEPDPKP